MSRWDEVLDWHRRDLQDRSRSGSVRVPLASGQKKPANDVTEDDYAEMDPELARATIDLLNEAIGADRGMVFLLVDGKKVLKHVDRLERSDLPHLAAYMEKEERDRREGADAFRWFGRLMQEEGLRRGLDKEQRKNMTVGEFIEGSSGDEGKEDA
jgi:hypothetical protein